MTNYINDGAAVNLDDLRARIRAAHEGVQAAARTSIEHALAAGDLLTEAKNHLKHGEWLPWLKEHCKVSERSAQAYMRLARHRSVIEAKSAAAADLTVQAALALLAAPGANSHAEHVRPASDAAVRSEPVGVATTTAGLLATLGKVTLDRASTAEAILITAPDRPDLTAVTTLYRLRGSTRRVMAEEAAE